MDQPKRSNQVPQCPSPSASDEFDTKAHRKMRSALNEPDNREVPVDKKSSKINNPRNSQISFSNEKFSNPLLFMQQPPHKKIKKNEAITNEDEEEKEKKKDKKKQKTPVKAVVPSQRKQCKAHATIKGSNTTKTEKKSYTCQECSKGFSQKNNLRRHMLVHSDKRPFTCDVQGCGRSFKSAYYLKRHQIVHIDVRAYSCNVSSCAQSFKTAWDLKEHVARHTDDRPYVCDVLGCNKNFKIAKDLKHHMVTHGSNKKYSCDDCPYITHYNYALTKHKLLHTGEKPYFCDTCDYTCNVLSNMKQHMLTHTDDRPFKCPVCQFATKSQLLLKRHNKVHQGPQPHKCNFCTYKTADKVDLDKHHRISHNRDKTLTCAHCPRVCSSPQALQQHEILHAVSTGTRHNPNTILNYLDEFPENGTQRCTTPNCITCNYILSRSEIPLSMDDEEDDNYSIPTLFNCKSKCVIYLISCSKCGAKYIGETARELRERFVEHLRAFADNFDRNLYEHFNQPDHSEENIHIEVLCHGSTDPQQRRIQESSFMLMFATYGTRNSLNRNISRILC